MKDTELAITKKNLIPTIQDLTDKLNELYTNGELSGKDLLRLHVGVKVLDKQLQSIVKDENNRNIIVEEFDKYGEKTIEVDGYNISKNVYKKYDYSKCNHPIIDLKIALDNIFKEPVKVAENQIKAISKATNLGNSSIIIERQSIEDLKEMFTNAFDFILDELGDKDEMIWSVNPFEIKTQTELIKIIKKR